MSTGEFHDVAHVVISSHAALAIGRVAHVIRTAAPDSSLFSAVDRARRRITEAPAIARVRLAGVFLLTATVTHAVLLTFVPAFVRPAALKLFRAEIVIASVLLIGAAPWLVHAWPGSRLRRIIGPRRRVGADSVTDTTINAALAEPAETELATDGRRRRPFPADETARPPKTERRK